MALQQRGVRLYDGDGRTNFDSGTVTLTNLRLIWDDEEQEDRTMAVELSYVTKTEQLPGSLTRSAKIVLHLKPAVAGQPPGPSVNEDTSFIRISFRKGGRDEFSRGLEEQLRQKEWEKLKSLPQARAPPPGGSSSRMRVGIMGIERDLREKQSRANAQVSEAFRDLDALIGKARLMVDMLNRYAKKVEEKKGAVTDDETVAFKAALLSAGIANPVTRETHGSNTAYHNELARQVAEFLDRPLQESGGIMTLADVYCRYNRARGLDLVSPDDLYTACCMFERLKLPIRLRQFDSGVLVVQSMVHSEETVVLETAKIVGEEGSLTADQLARLIGVSVVLATERLLTTEGAGKICRDQSIEGLSFFPNKFAD